MKTLRPMIFLAAILLIVGLACSTATGGDTPAQPPVATQEPVQVNNPPTTAPEPTAVPATEVPPPTEVVIEAQEFFTEEFDAPLSNDWSIFTVTGSDDADPDKVTVDVQDGNLVWDFDSHYLYYYLFYDAYEYEDVELTLRAENRGKNTNNISLICRYEEGVGWYEFNISNGGLYDIYYADVSNTEAISYKQITNGGSNAVKQGKDVNEYSVSCKGNKLTLTINGKEVTSVTEKNFGLRKGKAGVSVSSFDVLPILIEMDWIKIAQP